LRDFAGGREAVQIMGCEAESVSTQPTTPTGEDASTQGILKKKAVDDTVGKNKRMETRGIEPRTTSMLKRYYTTKPHPQNMTKNPHDIL
jgi:tartrate dehydratase beta subunit/fumarate hydratase class I family protein